MAWGRAKRLARAEAPEDSTLSPEEASFSWSPRGWTWRPAAWGQASGADVACDHSRACELLTPTYPRGCASAFGANS